MVAGYVDDAQRQAEPLGDDQEVDPARPRPDRRVRRAHPVAEGEAQGRRGQLQGRDRRALRLRPPGRGQRSEPGACGRRPRDSMASCRPSCPRVSPRPPTARCRRPRSTGLGTRPFGFYVHVPFCTVRCGYCDFNTYTATELGDVPGASRASYADAAIAEVRLARRVLGDVDLPVDTVFFGGGTPTLLPPEDLTRIVAAIDDEFGLAAAAEVTTESNPDSVDRRRPGPAARRRRHPGLVRHAVGGAARAARCSTAPTTRCGCPQVVRLGPRGRLRAGQPRPDLRHAGGVARRLAGLARGGAGLRAGPRLGVRPDRRGGHRAGPAGPPRRGADDRRRRPGRQVPRSPTRRSSAAGLRLVRGVELGARRRRPPAGTTSATGPAATGGASGRARTRTSAACGGGTSSTRRRTPCGVGQGVSPAHGREVLDEETRRVERVLLETRLRAGLPVDVLDDAGRAALPAQVERGPRRAGPLAARPGRADHPRAGCSPTPWCATCSADEADDQRVAVVLEVRDLDRGR